MRLRRRTEDNNIENQDDESDDATTRAVLPSISVDIGCDFAGKRGGQGESSQAELEEDVQGVLEHVDEIHSWQSVDCNVVRSYCFSQCWMRAREMRLRGSVRAAKRRKCADDSSF
jgi:hypothetical protein